MENRTGHPSVKPSGVKPSAELNLETTMFSMH